MNAPPPAPARDGRFVEIVEVGTRDGLQSERTLVPAARKIELIDAMIESGIRNIEVTSLVSPKAVPQLADAEEVIDGIARREGVYLMALVPNLRGAERACRTSLDGGVLLCSASETHNRKNVNRSIDASLDAFPAVAAALREGEVDILGAIATAFGCPFEGEVPFESVLRVARVYADLGARRITLGDTTGMATPSNVRSLVRGLRAELPGVEIVLHLHNTRGVGLANVMVGLDEGVRRFDAAVGGLGGCPFAAGATGNICTEDLVYLLHESGYETGVDLAKSIAVAERMEEILGKRLVGQVMRAGPRLKRHAASEVPTAAG